MEDGWIRCIPIVRSVFGIQRLVPFYLNHKHVRQARICKSTMIAENREICVLQGLLDKMTPWIKHRSILSIRTASHLPNGFWEGGKRDATQSEFLLVGDREEKVDGLKARRESRHLDGTILAEGIDFPEGSPSFSRRQRAMMRSLGARTLPTPSPAPDPPVQPSLPPVSLFPPRGRRVGANGVVREWAAFQDVQRERDTPSCRWTLCSRRGGTVTGGGSMPSPRYHHAEPRHWLTQISAGKKRSSCRAVFLLAPLSLFSPFCTRSSPFLSLSRICSRNSPCLRRLTSLRVDPRSRSV